MAAERPDEEQRRAYWIEQMDAAYRFMNVIAIRPVRECGERMVPIRRAARNAGVEMEFSTAKAPDGTDRLFFIREGLVRDLLSAGRTMNRRGWMLKVEDAYRTVEMQKRLAQQESIFDAILQRVLWERRGRRPTPAKMLHRVSALIATSPKVGTHMSGSAVDISVLSLESGEEVDRGAPYLEMSELTPMDSPFVSPEARKNRRTITAIMARHGFTPYPYEFWHYSQGDAYAEYLSGSGEVARYGPVSMDPTDGRTVPIPNPTEPLHTLEEIRAQIDRALERLGWDA